MVVLDDLSVETEIPIKKVTDMQVSWQMNEHMEFYIYGFLDYTDKNVIFRNYQGSAVRVVYKGDCLFAGAVTDTELRAEGNVYEIRIWGSSATKKLDQEIHSEMFQNVSITYQHMIRELVLEAGGQVICTVGNQALGKPRLCYEETVWQFAKRMANHFHSCIMPDTKTGGANFWFGIREGEKRTECSLLCEGIELKKRLDEGDFITSYQMRGTEDYDLGDSIWLDNAWRTIYKKEVRLERGEVIFSYGAARKEEIKTETYEQKKITGLCLKGSVERAEKEHVYIRLDIDKKPGEYAFMWRPETGTGLYAMPEPGAEAEIYFMEADEGSVTAIRCGKTKRAENDEKKLELPDGAKMILNDTGVRMQMEGRVDLLDNRIEIAAKQGIEISASGKIKLSSKILEIDSQNEIKAITDR